MPFQYQHFTISGSRDEVCGASEFVTKAKEFLESAGWTVVDDRRTEPGSAVDADTHKVVLSSDGEGHAYPTYYMTIASGTGSETNAPNVSFMMSTGYDVGTHDVLPTDAKIPGALGSSELVSVLAQDDFRVWMSGDSEGVVFITQGAPGPTNYDSLSLGRANPFYHVGIDPYPLYILEAAGTIITPGDASARLIAGNPPHAVTGNSQGVTLELTFAGANQPYTGSHTSVTSIFLAVPVVLAFTTSAANPYRGAIGTARNHWYGAGTAAGMLAEATLTASGSFGEQIYRAFPPNTVSSLVIRQS
jgi:hypothetical protein